MEKMNGQKWWYMNFFRPYARYFLYAFFFMVLSAVSTVLIARLFKQAFDTILRNPESIRMIIIFSMQIFLVFCFKGIGQYGERSILAWIVNHIIKDIQNKLFKHVIKQDMNFFKRHTTGELITRIVNELSQVRNSFITASLTLGKDMLTLMLLVIFMVYTDYKLAFYSAFFIPLALYPMFRIATRLNLIIDDAQKNNAILSSDIADTLSHIKTVKACCREKFEVGRFEAFNEIIRKDWTNNTRIGSFLYIITEFTAGILIGALVCYGAIQIYQGSQTPGDLMGFLSAILLAYEPIRRIAYLTSPLQELTTVFARVKGLLDEKESLQNGTITDHVFQGRIEFRNVTFGYVVPIIKNFNLIIEPGQRVAIMGASGVGKSSFCDLLLRFYAPIEGEILIDGVPLSDFDRQYLRQNIGYMRQESDIFNRSPLENIAYGLESEDDIHLNEIYDLLSKLGIEDKFEETTLGEDGNRLSGGEKQRFALARLLVQDKPIYILDEPTSALDTPTRKKVDQIIDEATKGKTVIIITHRKVGFVDKTIEFE